jgi:dynactin-5
MDWIETSSGNRISRDAQIEGSDHILIAGNTTVCANVVLHGNVKVHEGQSSIQLGKFCYLSSGVTIMPPRVSSTFHKAMKLGSYTSIAPNCSIHASHIGNRVTIGKGCELQNGCIVHDCVIIKPNTCIPEAYAVPPFSLVYQQRDQLIVETLPESYKKLIELKAKQSYLNNQFIPSEIP